MSGRNSGSDLDNLRDALRRHRPDPRDAFLDEMLRKVEQDPVESPRRSRLGFAVAFSLVSALMFGMLGGLGYASSSLTDSVGATASAFSSVLNSSSDTASEPAQSSASEDQYAEDVIVCHRPPGKNKLPFTLSVSKPALDGHLGHGDTLGPCP